jgi:unsaturated chondroitin disaccharide hydrolase
MLLALYERSSSRGQLEQQGILLHGTWHKKAGFGVDASLIFGDYYFMEALARTLGLTEGGTKGGTDADSAVPIGQW